MRWYVFRRNWCLVLFAGPLSIYWGRTTGRFQLAWRDRLVFERAARV